MTNTTISVYWQQKCNNRHNINEGFKYAESSVTETEIEKNKYDSANVLL